MSYSAQHVTAFKKWQRVGCMELTEDDIAAIEREDRETGVYIRKDIQTRRLADIKQAQRFTPTHTHAKLQPMQDGESLAEYAKRNKHVPVTFGMLGALVETMSTALKQERTRCDALETKTRESDQRIVSLEVAAAELRAKNAQLEARPMPTYRGVYENGKAYAANSLVTRGGGLWFATEPTALTPGAAGGAWRLIVKSGGA